MRAALAAAAMIAFAGASALAQNSPWPAPPQPPAAAPWPAAPGAPAQSAPAAPATAWPAPPGQAAAAAPAPMAAPWPTPGQRAAPASAPGFSPATGGGGFGVAPGGGGGGGSRGAQEACIAEFVKLREANEKNAATLQAAAKKKPPLAEVCGIFTRFQGSMGGIVKFMETSSTTCGIPADALKNAKAGLANIRTQRDKICALAANGGGQQQRSSAPSLSDALGTSRNVTPATPSQTATGRNTFDTLTGNALAR